MNSADDNQGPSNLLRQDEILQVMYWMLGEGLGTQVSIDDLRKFLTIPDEKIEIAMKNLFRTGLVRVINPGIYQLTEMGVVEGRRRFVDEFEGLLKQGHYECNDPECDCHTPEFSGACKSHEHPH